MTREEMDFIGGMNMCDEISNEAYKKIMCHCEESEPCEDAISRDGTLKAIIKQLGIKSEKYLLEAERSVYKVIKNMPSVQPEIIRCYQCKYAEVADSEDSEDGYTCQFHRGSIWFSGSYCSWAERRQDG